MVYLHAEKALAWHGIFLGNWNFCIESVCPKMYLPISIIILMAQIISEECIQVKYNFLKIFNAEQHLFHCRMYSHSSFQMVVWKSNRRHVKQCYNVLSLVILFIHTCQVLEYIYSLWYLNILGMISVIRKLSNHIQCNSKPKSWFDTLISILCYSGFR